MEIGDAGEAGAESISRRHKRPDSPEVGSALRSAYQQTVEERIPDDLLALLGRLN